MYFFDIEKKYFIISAPWGGQGHGAPWGNPGGALGEPGGANQSTLITWTNVLNP